MTIEPKQTKLMETTSLKLTQLRCANCHSTLSRANNFETQIKCPYCGTLNEVTGTTSQNVAAPERVILFQTQEADFDHAICKFFVDQDYTVNDIFEKVHMENATPIYLPMYLFEGKYEANYSCQIGYRETQVSTNFSGDKLKEKTVTKWRPMSGTAKNNYAFLSLAFDGQEIIPELAEWTRTFPYDPITAQPFDVEKLKNFQILPHNMDKETTWHKWGAETIKDLAEQEAHRQLPGDEEIKDFRTSFSYDEKHDGRLFLVPFWFIYYNYEGQKHFVVYDGLGRNIHGTTPLDEARYKSEQTFLKLAKWSLWIGLLLGVIFLSFAGFVGALITFGVAWLGLRIFSKWKAKNIIESARAIRQAAFNQVVK
jgi:phage FluMu protein Com